jgi:hypothetical protein
VSLPALRGGLCCDALPLCLVPVRHRVPAPGQHPFVRWVPRPPGGRSVFRRCCVSGDLEGIAVWSLRRLVVPHFLASGLVRRAAVCRDIDGGGFD